MNLYRKELKRQVWSVKVGGPFSLIRGREWWGNGELHGL